MSIYPQITTQLTPLEATPHLGFRDTCIAAHRERAIFYLLPGCPRIQRRRTCSSSSRMRTGDCHLTTLARSKTAEEFESDLGFV